MRKSNRRNSRRCCITTPRSLTVLLQVAAVHLNKPRDAMLEDVGTYLVSHPNKESLRRLLRFGGVTFTEFLHSLDDLPDRARLAVPISTCRNSSCTDFARDRFVLRVHRARCRASGMVLVGVLRAMADDYGALRHARSRRAAGGCESIVITLVETEYAEGRQFDLGGAPTDRRRPH